MRLTLALALALIAASLSLLPNPAIAQTTDACPEDTGPELTVGELARVVYNVEINLRAEPSTARARIGYVQSGVTVEVIDGPVCAEGFVWWQAAVDADSAVLEASFSAETDTFTAWLAAGNPSTGDPWLEARGQWVWVENDAGEPVAYVVDDEGRMELPGCWPPPDDYTRIQLGWATLNARTLAMLDHAQRLYDAEGGVINFRQAITQGSYNPGEVEASFGTHDAGGAVDLSVRSPLDWSIMRDEIEPMIAALRVAGFAAWLRDTGDLYPNSPIHIHAIAIGDAELSQAASEQIDGTFGYLRGYDGLPREDDIPVLDRHGGPIVCNWMRDLGYEDLRETENETEGDSDA